MDIRDWFDTRSFRHQDFAGVTPHDGQTTTLILPSRNVADTIGPILDAVAELRERTGLIDQVLVIDADSPDGTAEVARDHGAEVYSENELMPGYGPALGKGDAMWRSLSVARGDLVMFADADTRDFSGHFIYGTLGPLLTLPGIRFTKAAYRRPFTQHSESVTDGGGRVTELMAKPLLNLCRPELAGFVQPLAGEFAAPRRLLTSLPFLTGYGVELALLIDVLGIVGLPAMAQVDLGTRQNRHQPLWDLTRMSSTVLRAMARRLPGGEPQDPGQRQPDVLELGRETYLHAVATETGLRLDEHLNELVERPPLDRVRAELAGHPAAWRRPAEAVRPARPAGRPGGPRSSAGRPASPRP